MLRAVRFQKRLSRLPLRPAGYSPRDLSAPSAGPQTAYRSQASVFPWRPHAEPDGDLEIRQARFSGGRQIWKHSETLLGRRRVGLDQPALNWLEYIKRLITHKIELAADQVVQRRPGALVGNDGDRHLDRVQEQEAAKMGGRADSGVPMDHLLP